MPFVGHLPELLLLLVLALIVLGPKRMIEMGSSVGKALGEMRQQLKEVRDASGIGNLGNLMNPQEPQSTPFSAMSQFAQNIGTELHDAPPPPAATPAAAPDSGYTAATTAPDAGYTGTTMSNGSGPIVEGTIGTIPPPPPSSAE